MNMILQIAEPVPVPVVPDLSIFSLLLKGGYVMIPILLLSVAAFYILVERYLYIRSVTKGRSDLISQIKKYLHSGDIKAAKMLAEQEQTAMGRILLSGVEHIGKPIKEIETMMESASNIEVAEMERNTGYLGIIAGIAPMLGFVGTIAGIIKIFYNISLSDNISIGIIAGGLYEKMITSGSGLIVGVIAYASYHFLQQKINRFTLRVQKDVYEFMRSYLKPCLMKLKRRNDFHAEVATSSLNDIMFFLLLFFLIISTVTNPNVIKVLLPKSKASQTLNKKTINLTVTETKRYYINKQEVSFASLEPELLKSVAGISDPTIVLNLPHNLTIQDLIDVMQIGAKNKVKMVLATAKK